MSCGASEPAAGVPAETWGAGADAVLVHGSISSGPECWAGQRPLGDRGFRLLVPDRHGYGGQGGGGGEDYLRDTQQVVELLGGGAHLVGHSYGGLAALLAAAARPEAVRSLIVIEPPAFALVPDDPSVAELVAELKDLLAQHRLSDRAFLERFLGAVGVPADEMPHELLEHLSRSVGPMRSPHHRPPWEARIPADQLRTSTFPKLIISGGHHPAFDAVCDRLTRLLNAERLVITGAGHEVQTLSEPFNEALYRFWKATAGEAHP